MAYDDRAFLDRLAALFEAGDLDGLAAHCVMPLPVYFGEKVMVLGSRAVTAEALGMLRAMAKTHGMTRVQASIDAAHLPVGRHQNLYATWTYIDRADAVIGRSKVRYIVEARAGADTPLVHLVHYIETDFADFARQMPFEAPA